MLYTFCRNVFRPVRFPPKGTASGIAIGIIRDLSAVRPKAADCSMVGDTNSETQLSPFIMTAYPQPASQDKKYGAQPPEDGVTRTAIYGENPMDKNTHMLDERLIQAQSCTHLEIAEILGVCERTASVAAPSRRGDTQAAAHECERSRHRSNRVRRIIVRVERMSSSRNVNNMHQMARGFQLRRV